MTEIYYRASDLAAALSDLLISPWAKRWIDDYAYTAGIQEALHLIQDMINGEVPENMKIPAADVVEVVRCKNCKHRDDNDMCFMHHDYGEFVYLDGYCNYAEEVQG